MRPPGPAAVVVTPSRADGPNTASFLADAGLPSRVVDSLRGLAGIPVHEIGCLLIVEEALVEPDLAELQYALQRQPPWSDVPVVLVAGQTTPLSVLLEEAFPGSGNITLLQRPLHPTSLISAVRVALRARQRQYQVRDLLAQQERAVRQRDEFLAMLAHELRNPLAPIRNAVYLLGTLDIDHALFAKCCALIDKQARHITRLVDDLLDVSRLERGKVELRRALVDLNESAAAAAEATQPITSAHGHGVALVLPSTPVRVLADAVRVEQAVGNLIINAAKFTPDGGRIQVEVLCEGAAGVIAVTDNGVGIKPEMLEPIFELFRQDDVTLDRSQGGLGIGLTLVKRLVEMHGGSVHAFSAGPGAGARFEIRLPLHYAAPAKPAAPGPSAAAGPSRRVLIVEDGADMRETLGMLLEAWRHDVLYATNGPEGLARARESRPDIMLVDIGLPGFNGYQLARAIRGEGSDWSRRVRLIALTGYGQAADRARASEAGFNVHLLKPVDPVQLQHLLEAEAVPTA